jgi:hypothetical protein
MSVELAGKVICDVVRECESGVVRLQVGTQIRWPKPGELYINAN